MKFIDAHNHIQDKAFDLDRGEVLARAGGLGLKIMLACGTSEADWPVLAETARQNRQIVPNFGVHPWYVKSCSDKYLENLERILCLMPSGVGEIGLDHWIKDRDDVMQERVFRDQLALARCLGRPASIHCLQAWERLLEILRECNPSAGLLLHAYGGSVEIVPELVQMGAFFSFAGSALRANHGRAREALRAVPLERLLLETDSPDIMPPKEFTAVGSIVFEGRQRNEPANISGIYTGIAEELGIDVEELAAVMWENARKFLKGVLEI
jgi:TatD DNase family protein